MTMPPSSDEVLHGEESLLPELGRYLRPNRDDAELYDLHHPLLITLRINPFAISTNGRSSVRANSDYLPKSGKFSAFK